MLYDCYVMELVDLQTLEFQGAVSFVAMSRVGHGKYIQVPVLTRLSFAISSPHTPVFTITILSIFFCHHFFFLLFSYPSSIMSRNRNDTNIGPAVPPSRAEDTSQVVDASAASGTRVGDIDIDRGVRSWSVVEYKTRYVDTIDARRFGAMFLDGANSFVFDCRNSRRDTDIDA